MSDPHSLGDAPIEAKRERMMNNVAERLDEIFNGDKRGDDHDVGFVLMVFPFNSYAGRCNYISNGQRADVVRLLEDQLANFRQQDQKPPL